MGVAAEGIRSASVTVSGQTRLDGESLLLNGAGVRTLFGFRVYVAELYLPALTHEVERILDRDMPRRLRLTLLRDTTTDQNLDALRTGMTDNNSESEMAAIKLEVARFFGLIRQVSKVPAGTVIQLDYQPGAGTWLSIGERNLGLIAGDKFNRALMKIWLGADPIQTSLKKSLLGLVAEH